MAPLAPKKRRQTFADLLREPIDRNAQAWNKLPAKTRMGPNPNVARRRLENRLGSRYKVGPRLGLQLRKNPKRPHARNLGDVKGIFRT